MVLRMTLSRPALTPSSAVPLYEQVADHIATEIAAGHAMPGDKLPAERELAQDWGIAYGTMRSAIALLRDRGLIASRHGKGTFIA